MLIVAVCLVESGAVISVLSYYGLKRHVEMAFQLVGVALVSIGTIFGFWSVLTHAGEEGLFFPIMGVLFIVTEIALIVVSLYRSRGPQNDVESAQHKNNQAPAEATILYYRTDEVELSYHYLRVSETQTVSPETPLSNRGTAVSP